MQLDLNDYYPSSNLARLYRTRNEEGDDDNARVAAAITAVACERARARAARDPWLKPTLLGAAFDAGDVPRAKGWPRTSAGRGRRLAARDDHRGLAAGGRAASREHGGSAPLHG